MGTQRQMTNSEFSLGFFITVPQVYGGGGEFEKIIAKTVGIFKPESGICEGAYFLDLERPLVLLAGGKNISKKERTRKFH